MPSPDEQPAAQTPASGPDLARAALSAARAAARARGLQAGDRPRPRTPGRVARPAQVSGSGPDARDPTPFGRAIARLVAERGWQQTSTAAGVLAGWERLVGPQVADHCRAVSLVEGTLVLQAESSAWATQLRLLTRTLQRRITEQVGADVVTRIVVRGPVQADWRKGRLRVQGPGARGPRDTYG